MGIARNSGPGVPCRRVSGDREPPRHRRLRHVRARSGPCCPPASVRRAAIRGDLTGRAALANASLETITRGSRRTSVAVRGLAGGRREPVRIPVGEAAATCSPATREMSGNAFARAHLAFRKFPLGTLTGAVASKYDGSTDRRIDGSTDRRIDHSCVRPHGHERRPVPGLPGGSALPA